MNEKEFQPSELTVPAGKKIKLEVTNTGPTVAEFESYELNREKILVGGSTGTFYIGPLNPADYRFFNDFNKNVKGRIIAQ